MKLVLIVILAFLITGSVSNNRAREANHAYETGEYQRAEHLYREILKDHPDASRILFNLGNSLARQGKIDESVETFLRYCERLSDSSEHAPAEYNLGYLRGEAGWIDEALYHFRNTLYLDPYDDDAKFNYELLKRRQQESDQDKDDQRQDQQSRPRGGQPPPSSETGAQQDDDDSDQTPSTQVERSPSEEDPGNGQPEVTDEERDHAENIMNALDQIEKELIKDFKKRQHDPVDPHEKDW